MSRVSAKTFREPVLLTLLDLGQGKAGSTVHHTEVYTPCAQKAGVTLDEHGDTSEGKPKVVRWIQEAVKGLRKKHLVESPSKGHWALTVPGAQEARRLKGAQAAKLKPTPPEGGQATAPQKMAPDVHPYHDDPYIRFLAAESTSCFGGFSDRSPMCPTCPLKKACMDAMAAELAYCAELLIRKKDKPTPSPEPPRRPQVEPSTEPALEDLLILARNVRTMRVPRGSQFKCAVCNKALEPESEGRWVNTPKGRIFFHFSCYAKAYFTKAAS